MGWIPKIFGRSGANARRGRIVHVATREDPALARMWEAAMTDAQTLGWFGDSGITAYDLRTQLWTIRRRCREAAKNDPYVVRALQLFENNVVGSTGIRLDMDVRDPGGGGDIAASTAIEAAWRRWAESPEYCDVEGRKTLTAMLAAAVRSWKLEGEAIFHIAHSDFNPFGVQLKLYRADQLALDIIRQASHGENAILNGVEVNGEGRPVAYWFRTEMLPNGTFTGEPYRVPARQILHLFTEETPGQTRGVPAFASVLKDLRIAHAYDIAELIAARVDASRVGSWKQEDNGDTSQISETTEGIGFTQKTEPGEDRVIPLGWDYKPDAPARPNGAYSAFKKAVMRRIASGLSVSYNTLTSDLEGVSYSSIRAGTLEDREVYKMMQAALVDSILRPLFRRRDGWLDSFMASPLAAEYGFMPGDAARIRLADRWMPRRWAWVDPHSEAMSNEIAVAHHWTTNTDVAAETGRDYFDNIDTAKQEQDWMAAHGVADGATATRPAPQGVGVSETQKGNDNGKGN